MDDKELLTRYTMAAKKIVYDKSYLKDILEMLGTQDGAVAAVHSVISAIEKHSKVPPQLYSKLAVNVYIVMVDIAKEIFKMPPDKQIVSEVIAKLRKESEHLEKPQIQDQEQMPQEPMPEAPPEDPPTQGIIGRQMQGAPV